MPIKSPNLKKNFPVWLKDTVLLHFIGFLIQSTAIPEIIKSAANTKEERSSIEFVTIKSADKFSGDFGEPAGDDIKKVTIDGFYFEYHKGQYKKQYIKNLMKECIKDGVKTQVQMYCCIVKKLHN